LQVQGSSSNFGQSRCGQDGTIGHSLQRFVVQIPSKWDLCKGDLLQKEREKKSDFLSIKITLVISEKCKKLSSYINVLSLILM
jgi:hypothetical protein